MKRALVLGAIAVVLVSSATSVARPVMAASVPSLDHVVVIVMENHSYSEIINSSSAPYINSLLPSAGLATAYTGVTHPSLPNYLALAGGSTFNITSDCTTCWVSASNVADRLEAAGSTWKGYMESMPSPCFIGDSYPYAQKHNPFIYFNDIRTNTARCQAHVVPFTQLATDLKSTSTTPNLAFITPNMCNDMHDCSVATGDTWLKQQVPLILASPAFKTQHSLLAVTWDEDDASANNRVPLLLLGAGVGAGLQSSLAFNHYSLLRTIELSRGLSALTTYDTAAPALSAFFTVAPPPVNGCTSPSIAPAPGAYAGGTTLNLTVSVGGCTSPEFAFWARPAGGTWAQVRAYSSSPSFSWKTSGLAPGIYELAAWVRRQGTSARYEIATGGSYVLSGCSSATISPLPGSFTAGSTIGFTVSAGGCAAPEVAYWIRPAGGLWHVVRGYSTTLTYNWNTAGLARGTYEVAARVREHGSTKAYEVAAGGSYSLG